MAYKKLYDTPEYEPIEIDTDAGMTAVLSAANVGRTYKFTGTSSTYVTDDYYTVEGTPLCFTAVTANSTIEMIVSGTPTLNQNFSYSTDRETWTEFIPGTTVVTLTNVGDKVYFRGDNPNGVNEYSNYYEFDFTDYGIAASGNIMSLIDNGACNTLVIPNAYCFRYLFAGTTLKSAPSLPATTLTNGCYQYMFYNCYGFTTAPELPAMEAPSSCYARMFSYTSVNTPPALPATTLGDYCYQEMFASSGLTTMPALPATTLAKYCYSKMFYSTKITTAATISATSLANYACSEMFASCTKLTTPPSLPVTNLASGCYAKMFQRCTALVKVPALPATTLVYGCYQEMFSGCTALYVSDSSVSGTATQAWRIPTSNTFTTTLSQSNMFYNCTGTRSSNNMAGAAGASYTYYTQNTPV